MEFRPRLISDSFHPWYKRLSPHFVFEVLSLTCMALNVCIEYFCASWSREELDLAGGLLGTWPGMEPQAIDDKQLRPSKV